MLHLLYILTFTALAFLAIGNLVRSLLTLGVESQRNRPRRPTAPRYSHPLAIPHPELLDASGEVINEPLLVMRSMTMDDAREHLDSLYNASPGPGSDGPDDPERGSIPTV